MSGVTQIVPAGGAIDVVPADRPVVSIVASGPPGPPGPPGAAEAHVHMQPSAAAEWIVNHNFGERPLVQVFDTGGAEIEAHVVHVSANQARIYFAAAQAGSARCI